MKTEKNPSYFYNPMDFPELGILTQNLGAIQKELDQILKNTHKHWLETFPTYVQGKEDRSWEVFTFQFFNMVHPRNPLLCPITSSLLREIPELISCDFSKMKAHTHILPHQGYTRMVLRCHLPLIVPEVGTCGIRVGDETRFHETGQLLIFDDSFDHEAWNKGDSDRVVLMFDIPNPLWGYTADEISQYKISTLSDPFLLEIADINTWQKAYDKKELPV